MLKPFARFGVPAHELGMIMGIALRFMPQFASELAVVYHAQVSRGARLSNSPARGVHMLWVAQDLLDSRTISKRDMRRQVNLYMQTVMGEEPVRPDLVDFDDALTW